MAGEGQGVSRRIDPMRGCAQSWGEVIGALLANSFKREVAKIRMSASQMVARPNSGRSGRRLRRRCFRWS